MIISTFRIPVDCSFSMNPEQVKKIIEIGVQSEDVHSLIVIVQGEMLDSYVDTLAGIDYKGKPILCCVACKEFMMDHVIRMEQKGIPVYSTPEMAAEVLGEMYRYSRQCNKVRIKALERFLADNSLHHWRPFGASQTADEPRYRSLDGFRQQLFAPFSLAPLPFSLQRHAGDSTAVL